MYLVNLWKDKHDEQIVTLNIYYYFFCFQYAQEK